MSNDLLGVGFVWSQPSATTQTKLDLAAAAQSLKDMEDLANEATKTMQAIGKGREIAQAEEKTSAGLAPGAASLAQGTAVDQAAIGQVAIAVKEIVATAVDRDYLAQACFTLLTMAPSASMTPEQTKAREEQVKLCVDIIQVARKR